MEYKKGYKIKPYAIRKDGIVEFTDGTNIDLIGNERTCKAYGYEYDSVRGTCRAFTVNTEVWKIGKPKNKSHSKNSLEVGSSHFLSQNNNAFISGAKHEASNRVENISIIGGKLGKATISGEVVIGGGNGDDSIAGQLQTSIVHLSGVSEGGDVTLYAQGNTSNTEQIHLPANSITMFQVYITGICVGGSSGTAGHFRAHRITGSLICAQDGEITKTEALDDSWGTSGTTGTISLDVAENFVFSVQASTGTDINVQWNAVVKLYINQTKIDF